MPNFMKTIIEKLKENGENPRKIKKIILNDQSLKNELIEQTDFLKNTVYDDINFRYKYLRIGGTYENFKCPYCGCVRKMGASALYDTCGSHECVKKHQHNVKIKMHENMGEETKKGIINKMRETCIERYGVEYSTQSSVMKKKSAKTKEERYGNPTFTNQDKRNKTNIEKYGGKAPLCNDEIKKKMVLTNIKRYGVANVFQSELIKKTIKKTNLKKYGVEYPMMSKEIQDKVDYQSAIYKQIMSKSKNGTLHTSTHEKKILKYLTEEYGDVKTQYLDERYKNPNTNIKFKCDFYIPKFDLFIEYQGIYHHGNEPYDETNQLHKKILEEWREKSKRCKNSDYNEAIRVWTEKDPLKRAVAKKNKLNFLEVWNENGKCPSKEVIIKKINNFKKNNNEK